MAELKADGEHRHGPPAPARIMLPVGLMAWDAGRRLLVSLLLVALLWLAVLWALAAPAAMQ